MENGSYCSGDKAKIMEMIYILFPLSNNNAANTLTSFPLLC